MDNQAVQFDYRVKAVQKITKTKQSPSKSLKKHTAIV